MVRKRILKLNCVRNRKRSGGGGGEAGALTSRMETSCLRTRNFNKTPGKASVTSLVTSTSNLSIRYQSRRSGLLADRPDDVSMTRYDLESTMRKELSSSSSSSSSR